MLETLSNLPFPFWVGVVATIFFGIKAWMLKEKAIGFPMLMVLATVAFWYFGDVLYNGYADYCVELNGDVLGMAWWEVALFIIAFGLMTPSVHRWMNEKYLRKPSSLFHLYRNGVGAPLLQKELGVICMCVSIPWVVLMVIAIVRTNFNWGGLFAPYMYDRADPWGRGRLGGGFDSLLAVAGYVQLGATAMFGVLVAMVMRPRAVILSVFAYLLSVPSYVFDRTRNTMLVALLPCFLALVFLRLRVPIIVRIILVVVGFCVMESWLKFIIESRGEMTIATAVRAKINNEIVDPSAERHLGLNMFEELGFINAFFQDRTFRPNWGMEYLANLVNPIPRVIWPNKPMIGIDYAIARGMSYNDADANQAGVGASISTGMIGQGVVNFGEYVGPVFAAFLMSLWASILARQDLRGDETVWRLFLYAVGVVFTFNMGRDITLLVLYPFVFAYIPLFFLPKRRPWVAVREPHPEAPAIHALQFAKTTVSHRRR